MIVSYGSFRNNPPTEVVTIVETTPSPSYSIGSSYDVYVQFVNRAGRSGLTYVATVASDRIVVTINPGVINSTEDVFWVAIAVSETQSAADAYTIYQYQVRHNNQYTLKYLPYSESVKIYPIASMSIQDASLVGTLTTIANVGSIAYAALEDKFYRYDPSAQSGVDGLTSYGAIVSGVETWIEYDGNFNAYVPSIGGIGSSDVPISTAPLNTLKLPVKSTAIASQKMRFWINNGLTLDTGSAIAESQFTFEVKVNNISGFNSLFADKIAYQIIGYVDRSSATITYTPVDQSVKKWNHVDGFIKLTEPLERNHAAIIDVWLDFDNDELIGRIPFQLSEIQLLVLPVADVSGSRVSETAKVIGNLVLNQRGKFLILPDLIRASGIATFADGYVADSLVEQYVEGAVDDAAGQKVVINGALNGYCDVRQEPVDLGHGEFIRAVVSTETGESKIVQSNTVVCSNSTVTIDFVNPDAIRSNYPDPAIAGVSDGVYFNSPFFVVYFTLNSTVYKCDPEYTFNPSLTISSLSGIASIPSLPVNDPEPYFSLFDPESVSVAQSGTGSITGSFTAYVCYYYPSPNYAVTSIRHDTPECAPVLTSSLGDAINYSLGKSNNLSDLPDKAIARDNLGVYPKSVTDDHLVDTNNPHDLTLAQIGGASSADLLTTSAVLNAAIATLNSKVSKLEKLATKVNVVTSSSYAIADSDYRTILELNSNSTTTIVLDRFSLNDPGIPSGVFEFWIRNSGTGSVTFNLYPATDTVSGLIAPDQLCRIYYKGSGAWILSN